MNELEQVPVRGEDIELVVLPGAGARLHSLKMRGRELLRSPDDMAEHLREPFFWGGYVMAPWCGRLSTGPLGVGERTVDLRANFPDGSAIHGQVYVAAWQRTAEASFAIEGGGDGWPWRYRVEIDYAVDGATVSITQRVCNLDDQDMPAGIGLHPWFPLPVKARIASALVYASNTNSSPQPAAVTGDLDLRTPRALARGVDATWPEPADPPLELFWPDGPLHATVRAPQPTLHIVAAYAPERGSIAVEPQTHGPQGLRRLLNGEPGAMTLIKSGESLSLPISYDFDTSA